VELKTLLFSALLWLMAASLAMASSLRKSDLSTRERKVTIHVDLGRASIGGAKAPTERYGGSFYQESSKGAAAVA